MIFDALAVFISEFAILVNQELHWMLRRDFLSLNFPLVTYHIILRLNLRFLESGASKVAAFHFN